jgi:hypothetical protein
VQFVPITDLPFYGIRYLWARLHKLISRDNRLAFWGPELNDMQSILKRHTLNEVCAIQWQQCVEKADEALNLLPQDQVCRVQYETFVKEPKSELSRVLNFMGINASEQQLDQTVVGVSAKSIGKGRQLLGNDEVRNLENLVGMTLKKFGYMKK